MNPVQMNFNSADPGFCHVNFTTKQNGQTFYYLWLDNGSATVVNWELYRACRDWEPDSKVKIKEGAKVYFQIPKGDMGKLVNSLKEYLKEHGPAQSFYLVEK